MYIPKLPEFLLGKYQLIGTVTFSVLFAVVFLNIYIPYSDTAWLGQVGAEAFRLSLVFGFFSILILIISRILMYRSRAIIQMTYLEYVLWSVAEVAIVSYIYTKITLESAVLIDKDFWDIYSRAFLYGAIALGVPYIISGMYFAIIDKNKTIRLLNYDNVVTDEPVLPDTRKITLYDNSGALKLSLSTDNLYYIESDDNYIKVWYTDSKAELKQYMLRCRLKTVEESFKDSGLVRCHRKYIVNLKKVKVLRKESEGYVLELDNETIQPLPVTKTYTDIVLSHFTGESPLLEPLDY